MKVIIYEDNIDHFDPLINFYPQFLLRVGMRTVSENTADFFKQAKIGYVTRKLFDNKKIGISGPALYLSARAIISKRIVISGKDTQFSIGSQPIGCFKQKPPFPQNLEEIKKTLKRIKTTREIDGFRLDRLWDLIRLNSVVLTCQFKYAKAKHKIPKHVYIIGKKNEVFVGQKVHIHKFVTIDVSNGPVYIDNDVTIRPFSTIVGPSYIGPGSIIDRAKIIESSIGPSCRIGGEVESCIFQGYSNKNHEGFIGHSFIGEWVNLGALTTNSDLKNNYSSVHTKIGTKELDSGMKKLGCFIGDHTKTGISTLIPTGAIIGSFVNFFGGGMMPKYIPGFKWLSTTKQKNYDLEKAIATARIVMQRRNVKMSKHYEELIRTYYRWQNSL